VAPISLSIWKVNFVSAVAPANSLVSDLSLIDRSPSFRPSLRPSAIDGLTGSFFASVTR
jgi:hypothetical protein